MAYSREEAERLTSGSVGPEHLLLAILRENIPSVVSLLSSFGISPAEVKADIERRLPQAAGGVAGESHPLVLNEMASNILKLAVLEARLQRDSVVDVHHLLLAILHDRSANGAKAVLESRNMDYHAAINALVGVAGQPRDSQVAPGEGETPEEEGEDRAGSGPAVAERPGKQRNGTPVLDKFSTDLTAAAAKGVLDPVVGREKEILRLSEILCRRKKNNPILIGEPGVGKSAIVEGLAQLIASRRTSPVLFNRRIVSLDLTSIVAGTKYRGQFEERLQALLRELEQHPEVIAFIDEIHNIIGAGNSSESMDAANIMKPALARGTMQCIGATTLGEYRKSIESDGALERRFQKVLVEPATPEETLRILHNIKGRYGDFHHVDYTDEAIEACVRLTERYVQDRQLPDKAIDALDETGAKAHLKNATMPQEVVDKEKELEEAVALKQSAVAGQNFELAAEYRDRQKRLEAELAELTRQWHKAGTGEKDTVTDADVAAVVSQMSGVPAHKMAEAEGTRLRGMAAELKKAVVAQDRAVDKVSKAILRSRVGLRDRNHPIGVFMFLGPTGVGKTLLAKKLAEYMFGSAKDLIRIDMSEYSESYTVSRLVGAAPGYVGYGEGGQLTEKVRRRPYSIVLLDEIEKAHGSVYNLLLQVLDEGRLTDSSGRLVDFRNTVVILTSNTGTRQLKDFGRGIGFGNGGGTEEEDRRHARSIIQKSLSKQFAPEFLNRLDEIITFDQLGMDAVREIADIELGQLAGRMAQLGYSLEIGQGVAEFVARGGFDIQYGARPLKRAIQTHLEDPICELIVAETAAGKAIRVEKTEGKDSLDISFA